MKLLVSILLSFIIISGVGFAYSQTEPIPTWIKGVAGYWAEDKITDKEFVEALEFLIESGIIKVSDPKVLELENENLELRQKVKLLESENTLQPETIKDLQPQNKDETGHIATDKLEYGLGGEKQDHLDKIKTKLSGNVKIHIQPLKSNYNIGDIIQITGKIDPVDPKEIEYNLGGDKLDMGETIVMRVDYLGKNNIYQNAFFNTCYVEENYCSSGGDFLLNLIDKKKPIINDDGTISFSNSISITKDSKAGTYTITMSHYIKSGTLGFDYTQPFTVG